MECNEALSVIKEWLEVALRGKEPTGVKGNVGKAFCHIRECREEKCSQIRRDLEGIITSIKGVDLLIDEDGLLPFSC